MKPQSVVKHGRVPALLAVVLVMSLGFTIVLAGDPALTPGALVFQSPPPTPPVNDNFANANAISRVPYSDGASITYATTQPGEQAPANCTGSIYKTVWYAYTPANSGSFMASVPDYTYFSGFLAVWTGTELGRLTAIGCSSFWGTGSLAFRAEANTTYYIQLGSSWGDGDQVTFRFEAAPPPQAQFSFWPSDASAFDTIQFYDYTWDPAGMGIQSQAWDFGDGTTAQGCCPTHRYGKDGDYKVKLTVTTTDGRTGSIVQTVRVTTHDVAVSKIDAPQAAQAGQTRKIGVNIKNTRLPETVRVELFKSVPGGFQSIASTEQNIPVRSGNRTTAVNLSYTFTDADASVGKVTFRAVVYIVNARDALPADNEAVASPTKVSR
jgi:PKD repeat protein